MADRPFLREGVIVMHAQVRQGVPLVQVTINRSRPLWFVLDSGSTRMIIDSRLLRELHLSAGEPLAVQGPGGDRSPAHRVRGLLRIGLDDAVSSGYAFDTFDLSAAAAILDHPIDGILGAQFFDRFVVTIDCQSSSVIARARVLQQR
ncbi:MAG TPA: aspartyl protease family protein [Thermoanaerobaculia bacterium]